MNHYNMTHHVCESCGGVSDVPGICQTEGCEHKGSPLKECDCGDKEMHKKGGMPEGESNVVGDDQTGGGGM